MNTLRLACLLLTLMGGSTASAAGASKGGAGAGLRLGAAFPSPGSASLLYGLQLALPLVPGFRTGLVVDRMSSGTEVKSGTGVISTSTGAWILGLNAEYLIGATGVGVGLATGMHLVSSSVKSTDPTNAINVETSHSTPFVAPLLAWELPVGMLSVTAELRYLINLGDNPKVFSVVPGAKFNF